MLIDFNQIRSSVIDMFTKPTSKRDIFEIELELSSVPVVAETRRMRALWTPELAQDLHAFQNVEIGHELTHMWQDMQIRIEKSIAKRSRYKDRRIYIKEIEDWADISIEKGNGGALN